MKSSMHIFTLGILLLCSCIAPEKPNVKKLKKSVTDTSTGNNSPIPTTPIPTTPIPTAPIPTATGSIITDIKIQNLINKSQTQVPFTLGHAFIKGNLLKTEGLAAKLPDNSLFPLQVDVKALHTDGSVRHAILSGILPSIDASSEIKLNLVKTVSPYVETTTTLPTAIVDYGLQANVLLKLNGVDYSVNLRELLSGKDYTTWLSGPVANEFIVSSPVKNVSTGVLHPHLTARFAVRYFKQLKKLKIDLVMENGWAYEPGPQNFTYDIQVNISNQLAFSKTALTHYTRARWHKNLWTGDVPEIHIKHNVAYLIATKAVPNYDQSLKFSEATLNNLMDRYTQSNKGPMGNGIATAYMPATGGRPDIGLNPSWNVIALLSQDKRAKDVALGMGDVAGSWGVHFRDKTTNKPMSQIDFPHSTAIGGTYADYNKEKQRNELFPSCGGDCSNSNNADTSHQPGFSYIPYLLTGEHFYMEELAFYGMFNVITANPGYREYGKGLVKSEQVRGQAWTMRTFLDAAYILPEDDRLKSHFRTMIDENIKWFNDNYSFNPQANIFGVLTNGYALAYQGGTGVAPWQDDFFTSAIGRAVEYEIPGALDLLKYKAKFTTGRMTDPGACWILASSYSYIVKATNTSPFYTTFREAYLATNDPSITSTACGSLEMAKAVGVPLAGAMVGYPDYTAGYPSNFQPACAYTKDAGVANGARSWELFIGRTIKPDYSTDPQFAIIPRTN